ncbi:MAG TPA: RsmE family RNA methyltransferase [Opitutaceae bacterium]|nr:RsmE family RNA methyltransferase [Opitutaceae bacterium]
MNLILFDRHEIARPLPRSDPRATHLLNVLRRDVGGTFDAGLINGARGKGTVAAIGANELTLSFAWGDEPPPLDPITLLVGLPRPQTARKILQEATSLGVSAVHFVATEKSDPNYRDSVLWSSGEWRRHLLAGAEQAFCTRIPEVTHDRPLSDLIPALATTGTRVALDNYESVTALSAIERITLPAVIAVGAERGWSATEREWFRQHGFVLAGLGTRVLRVETACIAALALVKARAGLW